MDYCCGGSLLELHVEVCKGKDGDPLGDTLCCFLRPDGSSEIVESTLERDLCEKCGGMFEV